MMVAPNRHLINRSTGADSSFGDSGVASFGDGCWLFEVLLSWVIGPVVSDVRW